MGRIQKILQKETFEKEDLVTLLSLNGEDEKLLFSRARQVKLQYVENLVYFRGLIEFSNICTKDCYYCGIRHSNKKVNRYNISDEEILNAARFAWENNYGSIVLQSGEISSPVFANRIEHLLQEIKHLSNGELGVTLSLGEQNEEIYRRWFNAGAHRYLLRIEASNKQLYKKFHPSNVQHDYERRIESLKNLQSIGYQTGTGIMIGLPFQTMEDLADDLLFMKNLDVDMVGMGPYIEHADTPLYRYRNDLMPITDRFRLALRMIAILRIMMKDINIAAATALQAIDPLGREKAVKIGANIIMPNITPGIYRNDYALYENKPCVDEEPDQCKNCLDARITLADGKIGYGAWGDSKHFFLRKAKEDLEM